MHKIRAILALFIMLISSACFSVLFFLLRTTNMILLRHYKVNIYINTATKSLYFLWIMINEILITKLLRIQIEVPEINQISGNNWYVLTSNHQSFFDIILVQIFCRRHNLYNKFFMKESLIYLPFIGVSCWGLDFVFIKRFSRNEVKRNPEKIAKQHNYILAKCELYKSYPCTIVNFVEGTRYSKKKAEKSSYKNILGPNPMGLSLLMTTMQPKIKQVIDISIVYPESIDNFFDFFFKKNNRILLSCNIIDVDKSQSGDYRNDKNYRASFNKWLKQIWLIKDQTISSLKQQLQD